MPENQKKLIDSYEVFLELLPENIFNRKIKDYNISLSYNDFIIVLKDKDFIEFKDCEFYIDYSEPLIKEEFKCRLSFKDCYFGQRFDFNSLILINNILFYKCGFYIFSLRNLSIQQNKIRIDITLCHANRILLYAIDKIEISIYCTCENEIMPKYCTSSIFEIHNKKNNTTEYINYNFENIAFNFYNSKIISFTNCCFNSNLTTNNSSNDKLKEIRFNSCKFENTVDFSNQNLDIITISDSTFNDKLLIIDARITYLELINCSFQETVKIVDLKGEIKEANFERSTIKGMFFFNGFKEIKVDENEENNKQNEIQVITNGKIKFNHIFVEPTGYLIIRQITNGNFNFDYANILGQIVMQELDIDSL
ncbi:MAG: hypothetical protein ACRCXV_11100, partial [Bacteroidales bacterium]